MNLVRSRRLLATVSLLLGLAAGFGAGPALAGSEEGGSTSEADQALEAKVAAVKAARDVMDAFMSTFNARDEKAWAATFNYPHIRIASGKVRISETAADIEEEMDFAAFAKATGWHHSAWDKVELVEAGADKVHFAVRFTRYKEDGEVLAVYDSLYVVTRMDGHWGVQARSSFAP